MEEAKKSRKGFAAMTPEQRREIASKGGKAAQATGKAHRFNAEEARTAGRKGGATVSADKSYMSKIGKVGGSTVSADRIHMSEIGKLGGSAASADRTHMSEIGKVGGASVSSDREHMSEIGKMGVAAQRGGGE